MEINNTSLNALVSLFEYFGPSYKHGVESYYYECKDNIKYFKKEILDNLIILQENQKEAYFDKIRYTLNEATNSYLKVDQFEIVNKDYQELLIQWGFPEIAIDELIEKRDSRDYKSLFFELISFELDGKRDYWDLEYRETKGDDWVVMYFKVEWALPVKVIEYFINEINKFIEGLSGIKHDFEVKSNVEKLPNYNKKEQFVILKEMGFFDNKSFLELTSSNKEKILSILLSCHIDYARDLINNNAIKYSKDEKNGIKTATIEKIKKILKQ